MSTHATEISIYWDTADPQNEGWAYRMHDHTGAMADSGPYDIIPDLPDEASDAQLAEAVVALAYGEGITIATSDVATSRDDGGYAVWSRPDDED